MEQTVTVGDRTVTRIGLGTNRLRHSRENVAFIKAAVGAGVQMIDTAHLYTGGESEETICEALSPVAEDVVVATKGGSRSGRPEVLRAEIEDSLRRLRSGVIYLYYLHRVDPQTPLEESLAAIKEYQDRDRIRFVGISEVTVEQVERARKIVPIAAVQNQYNLEERRHDPVVDYCTKEQIPFVPFYPLRGSVTPALRDVSRRHRATPEQVKLSWLLRRSPMMLPIPGTLRLDHLNQNLTALEVDLTDDEFRSLSA
jgi:pyridoxine 4-dehydrogenase